LKGFQVLLDVGPFEDVAGMAQLSFTLLTKNESQKAAKNMTANGPITLMEDGAGIEQRLYISKDLFDLPQPLVV
jgi:hypothetical protein